MTDSWLVDLVRLKILSWGNFDNIILCQFLFYEFVDGQLVGDLVRLKIFSWGKGGARTWWADDLICQQHRPGQHHHPHHHGHHGHHHHHQHHGGLMI